MSNRVTLLPKMPDRPVDAHKGVFGTVIVVGGCETMMGAPALSASAALRAGAGLVKVAAPAAVLPVVFSIEPCVTGVMIGDDRVKNLERMDQADPKGRAVLAVGPGMGDSSSAGELVIDLLQGSGRVVLDADGLNLLAASGWRRPDPGPDLVLTPHPGEFERLAKPLGITKSPTVPDERIGATIALAEAYRAVVVLKGQNSVVSDGKHVYVNTTGGPAMATGGSGDVLTGVIAGLMAQGMSSFEASVLGVYLHGLAGGLWEEEFGPVGMTARELVGLLPSAMSRYRENGRG